MRYTTLRRYLKSHGFAHRWTFADETVRRVAGDRARPAVSAGPTFAAVEHLIAALAWRTAAKRTSQSVRRLWRGWVRFCAASVPTCVTGAAFASVAVGELNAVVGPSGVTGVRQTLVDVPLAAFADVAGQAHALVAPDAVHAFAVVEALGLVGQWVSEGGAVVQVNLTVDTFKRNII